MEKKKNTTKEHKTHSSDIKKAKQSKKNTEFHTHNTILTTAILLLFPPISIVSFRFSPFSLSLCFFLSVFFPFFHSLFAFFFFLSPFFSFFFFRSQTCS